LIYLILYIFYVFRPYFIGKMPIKKILIAYLWGGYGEFLKKRLLHYCNSSIDGVEICFSKGGGKVEISRVPRRGIMLASG
jgi:hypothetical protein